MNKVTEFTKFIGRIEYIAKSDKEKVITLHEEVFESLTELKDLISDSFCSQLSEKYQQPIVPEAVNFNLVDDRTRLSTNLLLIEEGGYGELINK